MKMKYSVLMTVYYKENPIFLKKSLNSMINQTIKPDEIVLMCDGPLNNELDDVIDELDKNNKGLFNIIRIKENKGLGNALRLGVENCKNDLIARMDSDDIARKDRCEKQLKIFETMKDISIVGSNVSEFTENEEIIDSVRKVPELNDEIIKFSKYRNPFNHPSVMYKKQDVLDCGNYRDVRYMQDYYLWIDMLSNGKKGYNIQDNLVNMRAGNNLFKRRSGKEYYKIQKNLFKIMKEKKYISSFQYDKSITIRTLSAFAPNFIRKNLFKRLLRRKK